MLTLSTLREEGENSKKKVTKIVHVIIKHEKMNAKRKTAIFQISKKGLKQKLKVLLQQNFMKYSRRNLPLDQAGAVGNRILPRPVKLLRYLQKKQFWSIS